MYKKLLISALASSFLVIFTAYADNVSLRNDLKTKVEFKVETDGFTKNIYVNPGKTLNPLGRDLIHNEKVNIYALNSDGTTKCASAIQEDNYSNGFYLPRFLIIPGYASCKNTNNFPCDCWNSNVSSYCFGKCEGVSNGQSYVTYTD